jgi:hypothetical protein
MNNVDYKEKMNTLLKQNLTNTAFNLWTGANEKIPSIWDRQSSSSGKYHNKENGYVPTIAEHTYEMLQACIKIWTLFEIQPQTEGGDILLLAIAFHDIFKYGRTPETSQHTDSQHDTICANLIEQGKNTFLKVMNENSINLLQECVRFHSGRWSNEAPKDFDFKKYHPFVLFVHFLDMMSSRDLIKVKG